MLATDVYLKFLEPLAGGPVEVLEHDILAQPLPEGEFDLVHSRLLVEHIGFGAVPNLVAGLRPGGILLLEDYDMACRGSHPDRIRHRDQQDPRGQAGHPAHEGAVGPHRLRRPRACPAQAHRGLRRRVLLAER